MSHECFYTGPRTQNPVITHSKHTENPSNADVVYGLTVTLNQIYDAETILGH